MKSTTSLDLLSYQISPVLGFLSRDGPATHFTNPYYEPWDSIISELPTLIKCQTIEKKIELLPLLSTKYLDSETQYQRAYVVLAFLAHAWIWTDDPPNDTVPVQISQPFLEVCEYLGMQRVLSYAGLCLWNWTSRGDGPMELQTLETLASFTGTQDEAAFYHVPVLVEAAGGGLVSLLLDSLHAAAEGDFSTVISGLNECANTLELMSGILPQLYTNIDAQFFYHKLRPFLAGGRGMEEKGLPHGMVFKLADGSLEYVKSVGGSAAQSSLFQFLDLVLGIHHKPLAVGASLTVFEEMRQYMPGKHREFLARVSQLPNIRALVQKEPRNNDLEQAFATCVEKLQHWRGRHIAVVSKFIVQPARAAEQNDSEHLKVLELNGTESEKEWKLQGTGSSSLIPFLRQARDETVP